MVKQAVEALPPDTVVVSGAAPGVDREAVLIAKARGLAVIEFPADWRPNGVYDKAAGFKRNVKIVEAADRIIAFQFDKSKGTQHTINIARKVGKPVELHEITLD